VDIVKEIVNQFRQGEINLPSLPQINRKFQKLINQAADYRQISDLLKQDLAITSKLIMVSNSAFYRGVEINRTLEQAVSRLGISVTQQYVNVISNRALYTVSKKKYLPMIERLWSHSLASAYACQLVAAMCGDKGRSDSARFVTGLLPDIGKLILIQVISELEVKGKFAGEIPVENVVKIAETYHGQFGSALLKRWQFSNECVGVAQHHDNLDDAGPVSGELYVVHFANQLAKVSGFAFANGDMPDIEMSESAQSLKIDPETVASMKKDVAAYMDNVGKMLS
jgi:HD-like signal output (HDOD) protein